MEPYLQPISQETSEEVASDAEPDLVFVDCPFHQHLLQVRSMAACGVCTRGIRKSDVHVFCCRSSPRLTVGWSSRFSTSTWTQTHTGEMLSVGFTLSVPQLAWCDHWLVVCREVERYKRFGELCNVARNVKYVEYKFVSDQLTNMARVLQAAGAIDSQSWFQNVRPESLPYALCVVALE